jgi:hypothetical protein
MISAGVKEYKLPWRKVWDMRRTGNSLRATFTQLMIHHMNNVVAIEFSDGSRLGQACDMSADKGFFGIQRFTILQPDIFNGGKEFGSIHTIEWAKVHLEPVQAKANIRLWSSMGMRQTARDEYTFSTTLRQRHLDNNTKCNEIRLQKKKNNNNKAPEPPANPAASISFLLCSPDDLLRDA